MKTNNIFFVSKAQTENPPTTTDKILNDEDITKTNTRPTERKLTASALMTQFLERTSFHLLGRITTTYEDGDANEKPGSSKRVKQVLFLLIFLASLSWSVRTVYEITRDYLGYPVTTTVEFKNLERLPAVTVCGKTDQFIQNQGDEPSLFVQAYSEMRSKNSVLDQKIECIKEPLVFRSLNDWLMPHTCFTCLANNTDVLVKHLEYAIKDGFAYVPISLQFWQQIIPNHEAILFVHPPDQHFSSFSTYAVNYHSSDVILVHVKTTEDLPSPYSSCQNVDQAENEQLSFYAGRFEYTRQQCLLSCLMAFFLQPSSVTYGHCHTPLCAMGMPCNPLNLTSAFGFDLSSNATCYANDHVLNLVHHASPTSPEEISNRARYYDYLDACSNHCPKSCFKTQYDVRVTNENRGSAFQQRPILP